MATQQEYTIGANALVKLINTKLDGVDPFKQAMIRNYLTAAMINEGAGQGAQTVLDAVDAFRAEKQAHAASFHASMSKAEQENRK